MANPRASRGLGGAALAAARGSGRSSSPPAGSIVIALARRRRPPTTTTLPARRSATTPPLHALLKPSGVVGATASASSRRCSCFTKLPVLGARKRLGPVSRGRAEDRAVAPLPRLRRHHEPADDSCFTRRFQWGNQLATTTYVSLVVVVGTGLVGRYIYGWFKIDADHCRRGWRRCAERVGRRAQASLAPNVRAPGQGPRTPAPRACLRAHRRLVAPRGAPAPLFSAGPGRGVGPFGRGARGDAAKRFSRSQLLPRIPRGGAAPAPPLRQRAVSRALSRGLMPCVARLSTSMLAVTIVPAHRPARVAQHPPSGSSGCGREGRRSAAALRVCRRGSSPLLGGARGCGRKFFLAGGKLRAATRRALEGMKKLRALS